jgi:hypothetical protein
VALHGVVYDALPGLQCLRQLDERSIELHYPAVLHLVKSMEGLHLALGLIASLISWLILFREMCPLVL